MMKQGLELVLFHIEKALEEVLDFSMPSDNVLSLYFRKNSKIGSRERGIIAEAVYAVLRNYLFFNHYARSGEGTLMRRLALLGLAASIKANTIGSISEPEQKWLHDMLQFDRTRLSPEMQADMPKWLYEKLLVQYGREETSKLAEALNFPAPLDLRINTLKARMNTVASELERQQIIFCPTPYAPSGLRIEKKAALQNMAIFKEGAIEIQDEGSQILALITGAKRGEMVADFCAGSGGKTLALGAVMRNTGRLYAFDISDRRLSKMKPRLERSGLSNVHPVRIAHEKDAKLKRFAGKMDRVLVDSPCSGTGTIRRNPEIKWRQTPDDLEKLVEKQKMILESASRLVKPKGRLIYATCSLLEEENETVVRDFLSRHQNFRLCPMKEILAEQKINLDMDDYLKLLPHRHQTDGFFAAVLEKSA